MKRKPRHHWQLVLDQPQFPHRIDDNRGAGTVRENADAGGISGLCESADHGTKESRALLSVSFVFDVAEKLSLGRPLEIDHCTVASHEMMEIGGLFRIRD